MPSSLCCRATIMSTKTRTLVLSGQRLRGVSGSRQMPIRQHSLYVFLLQTSQDYYSLIPV